MKRRFLLVTAATAAMIAIAALATQQRPGLLLLEWAHKAPAETPPTAVLLEFGLKDVKATDWSGRATVAGARVVSREGYRFRPSAGDKLAAPDAWQASSHRGLRVPAFTPQSLYDLRQTLLEELAWLEQAAHRQTDPQTHPRPSRRPHRLPAVPPSPTP